MFYGWWVLILLFVTSAFGGATVWHSFTAFFDPLIEEFGWSYAAISLAASLRGMEVGLVDIVIGFLIDRLGGRLIVFAGAAIVGIGYLLLSQVNSLGMFYALFILIFIGCTGLSNVVFFTLVTRWFRKRLGLALGITAAGYGAGAFAVPGVVYLLDAVGFRMTFVFFGVSSIVMGAVVAYFLRERPEDMGLEPDGGPVQQTGSQISENSGGEPLINYTFKEALHTPAFWILIYVGTSTLFATTIVSTHVMPYLENQGYARYTAGLVAMMFPILSMVGRLVVGFVADLVKFRVILLFAIAGQIIGMVLFYFAYLPAVLAPFVIIFGMCSGGVVVLRATVLRRFYGPRYIGSIIGFVLGSTAIGSLAGPVLAGWIFDVTNSYDLAWIIIVALLSVAVPLILVLKQPEAVVRAARAA